MGHYTGGRMNYSQKANPNATNSEMDSKIIIKRSDLTDAQRDQLREQFAELVVDGMDMKTLVQYVYDDLIEYYEDCSDVELKEQIDDYDEDLYDELVDNVTTDDAVKEVEKCIIDTNGEYAECVDHLVETMENG